MKKYIILFFIINVPIFGQINNKYISSLIFDDYNFPEIVNEENIIEGYLFIKITKKNDSTIYRIEDSLIFLNIFFINQLSDFNNYSKRYLFLDDIFLFDQISLRKKKMSKEIKLFFNDRLNKRIRDSSKCILKISDLRINILDKNNFWNYYIDTKIGYFIFKVSLKAAIIKSDLYYPIFEYVNGESVKTKKLGSITQAKILLTLGKCIEISEINSEELIKYGFIKSDWYPDFL
jgi:hypothetical protein